MVREIKTAVMLNVNIMNQIWYKNKFAQKNFKGTLMQIWNLLTISFLHENNVPKVSHYNIFYFLIHKMWHKM